LAVELKNYNFDVFVIFVGVFFIFMELNAQICNIQFCVLKLQENLLSILLILKVKRLFDYQNDLLPLSEFKELEHSHGCAKLGGNTG